MMRWLSISLRTAHLAAMGVLLGGHAFEVAPERLKAALWTTVATGVALVLVESRARLLWFHQGSGLLTLAKVAILCAVPLAWDQRWPLLLAVVVVGSIGSHMPGRYRHYSVLYRRVVHESTDPEAGKGSG